MAGKRKRGVGLRKRYPILEFDASREAIIEPSNVIGRGDVPEHCVLCFFPEVIEKLRADMGAKELWRQESESGTMPVLEIEVKGGRLAAFHPGVGASLAAAHLEEVIALGCRKFIACGGAGVLNREIASGHIIVPTSAVRDEGTSYHYLPPSREVSASAEGVEAICRVLSEHKVPFTKGKSWTTDAFYRETPSKVALRRDEGCLTVEMEAAAFFSVAEFRGVTFAQMLYGGDDVSGLEWDAREWDGRVSAREGLFWLAAEACLQL